MRGTAVPQQVRGCATRLEQARPCTHCPRTPRALHRQRRPRALAIGADGVHLGRDDGDIVAARCALRGKLIGVSCYDSVAAARAAVAAGADYVAFGSVFPSATKPGAVRAPLGLFEEARALGVPRVAIGGITPQNAASVLKAGADALAVISALFDAPISERGREFTRLFASQPGAIA